MAGGRNLKQDWMNGDLEGDAGFELIQSADKREQDMPLSADRREKQKRQDAERTVERHLKEETHAVDAEET